MLVYVWSRRNPMIRMNFFGLLIFRAPYLPWVLLVFSFLLGKSITVELLGMAVGHFYYFLEDVFPTRSGGIRVLKTPRFLTAILDPETVEDPNYVPLPEDRPGGFDWGNNGEGQRQEDQNDWKRNKRWLQCRRDTSVMTSHALFNKTSNRCCHSVADGTHNIYNLLEPDSQQICFGARNNKFNSFSAQLRRDIAM